jgi:hypothetical protein
MEFTNCLFNLFKMKILIALSKFVLLPNNVLFLKRLTTPVETVCLMESQTDSFTPPQYFDYKN